MPAREPLRILLPEVVSKTQAQIRLQRDSDDAFEWLRLVREGKYFGGLAGVALSDQEIGREGHTIFEEGSEDCAAELCHRNAGKVIAERLGLHVFKLAPSLKAQRQPVHGTDGVPDVARRLRDR